MTLHLHFTVIVRLRRIYRTSRGFALIGFTYSMHPLAIRSARRLHIAQHWFGPLAMRPQPRAQYWGWGLATGGVYGSDEHHLLTALICDFIARE